MLSGEMRRYYHKRATEYDQSMGYNDASVIKLLTPVIDQLKLLTAGRNVLEIACGPGFWTTHIASVANRVTATDYNVSTLEQAQKKTLPWEKVCLKQTNAYHLEAVNGEFDTLVAVDWLAHVPLPRMNEFFDGICARFALGSQIIFIDQLTNTHSHSGEYDEQGNHIQTRTLLTGEVFKVIKHYFSDQQYKQLLAFHVNALNIKRYLQSKRVLISASTAV